MGRRRIYSSNAERQQAYRRRRKIKVYHRQQTVEWETPHDLFAELDKEFGFTLDVAASHDNAKVLRYFTRADDGLSF